MDSPGQLEAKPEKKRHKALSSRQYQTIVNFIEGIKSGDNITLRRAAQAAGYSESYSSLAAKVVNDMMSRNEIVREMMEKNGIGVSKLVSDLKEISKATCPPSKYDAGGRHPDYAVRQRNAEFRADLLDVRPPKRVEVDQRNLTIVLDEKAMSRIREIKGPPADEGPL